VSRRSLIVVALVAIVLVLAAAAYLSKPSHRTAASTPYRLDGASQVLTLPRPTSSPRPPTGSPAIKLSTTGTPGYTLDEAKQFVLAHPIGPRTDKTAAVTITRAEFMSSKDVSTVLGGARTGFADDYMLCYVELTGTFTFSGPQGATRTFHRQFEVFDAQTGNFLMTGGLRD
jgi:hypothetical protein